MGIQLSQQLRFPDGLDAWIRETTGAVNDQQQEIFELQRLVNASQEAVVRRAVARANTVPVESGSFGRHESVWTQTVSVPLPGSPNSSHEQILAQVEWAAVEQVTYGCAVSVAVVAARGGNVVQVVVTAVGTKPTATLFVRVVGLS